MMKALLFFCSAAVAAFAVEGMATAQSQPVQLSSPSSTALDDKARELFREGVKAAEKSQWAKAHAAFLAAWSLKQHYQNAGNLGTSEAMLGKWRDAAEHLAHYLREAPKEKAAERKSAEELLTQARAKVGTLTVRVEPAGAEVFVDGKPVGKAPLPNDLFVDPGPRVIEARLAGHAPMTQTIDAMKGGIQKVVLALTPLAPEAALGSSTSKNAGGIGQVGPASEVGAKKETKSPPVPDGPNKGVIISGIAVSVVGIGMGAGFAVASNGFASDAEEQRAAALQQGVPYPCMSSAYATRCNEHTDTLAARDRFGDLAVWSFVVGGVAGAGTALYALVWPRSTSTSPVRVAPVASSRSGRLILWGEW